MRIFPFLLFVFMLTTPASAYTGLDLLRDCSLYESLSTQGPSALRDPDKVMGFGRCAGYLQGIHDANQLVVGLKGQHAALYCSPSSGLETEQLVLIILDYLKKNPAKINESARINVVVAMVKAFPC